jgi:predicted phage terminase large subunit-like protein
MTVLPTAAELERLLKIASPEEQAELTKLLDLQLSLDSPLAYAMRVSPMTQPFAHTVLLDKYLVALIDHALYHRDSEASRLRDDLPEGISDVAVFVRNEEEDDGSGRFEHPVTGEECVYNLAISMPPQHGKSYMVSEHLPAWYMTKYPERNCAIISYEETFATSWSSKVKTIIEDHPEYGIELDPSTKAKGLWKNTIGGGMMAAGVGGPLTGRSLHLTIMDDLIKNAEEALSDAKIKGTQDWWLSTCKTRNQSPRQWPGQEPQAGVRLLMHTRWSKNDLIGFTQRTEDAEWFYLNLPALSEGTNRDHLPEGHQPDPLGRPKGNALAPMLHSKAVLERLRDSGDPDDPDSGGEFWFSAMYQGYPTVEGSGIFSDPYFYYKRAGNKFSFADGYTCYYEDLRHFASTDLAISTKTRADWTVFMECGQAPDGRLVVVDVYRFRLEAPDHEPRLREWLSQRASMMFVCIEDKTFGSALLQSVNRKGGFIPRPMKADVDKITRAIPAGQAIRNERVWWATPNQADWVRWMEAEMSAFPTVGVHDDIIDSLAYAVQAWLTLGQRHPGSADLDQSMEAKVRRDLAKRLKKRQKGRPRHPMLGRL